ncbi:MAG: hypothetical protein QW794_06700 [Thermosphaera sp.]
MSKTIELIIRRPDGTTDTQITTSTPDGSFSFRIKLDKEGEWSFTARFAGDLTHEEAVSRPLNIVALPATVVAEAPKASAITWSLVAIALVALGLGIGLYIYRRRRLL